MMANVWYDKSDSSSNLPKGWSFSLHIPTTRSCERSGKNTSRRCCFLEQAGGCEVLDHWTCCGCQWWVVTESLMSFSLLCELTICLVQLIVWLWAHVHFVWCKVSKWVYLGTIVLLYTVTNNCPANSTNMYLSAQYKSHWLSTGHWNKRG